LNKKNSKSSSTTIGCLFYAIVPILGSLPIVLFLNDCYYSFQISKLSNDSTLLFIHDYISRLLIFASPCIIIFLIIFTVKNHSHMNVMEIKICLCITISIFIISTFLLFFEFFNYTYINKEGLHVRNNIFSNVKDYKWKDVTYAKVSYKRGNKGSLDISYDIYLNDGKIVHADDSEDFFDDIINLDNLMQNEKIIINRQKIQSIDYNDFVSQYQGKGSAKTDRLEVVLKILDK
jgi:hypothetical protein